MRREVEHSNESNVYGITSLSKRLQIVSWQKVTRRIDHCNRRKKFLGLYCFVGLLTELLQGPLL